jgi:hypothetical protein
MTEIIDKITGRDTSNKELEAVIKKHSFSGNELEADFESYKEERGHRVGCLVTEEMKFDGFKNISGKEDTILIFYR